MAVLLLACVEPTGRARFERDVAPVLEAGCADGRCHGVTPGVEESGATLDWSLLTLKVNDDGTLRDLDQAYERTLAFVTTTEDPAFSTLLRKPLAKEYGGIGHYGGEVFLTPDDPRYAAIAAWIETEEGGGEDEPALDEREALFSDTVQPHLVARGCMTANCHGVSAALPFRFDGGVGNDFPRASTRTNYRAALSMLALDGDTSRSRLIRKGLALSQGGIVHKGGNSAFFTGFDDEAVAAIEAWACAERAARVTPGCGEACDGFVYVRGPVLPEDTFDLDQYSPGSDVWWAHADGTRENLTASLHAGDADVRDPAIDATGGRLAFSMREAADAGHHLWVLDLATREARKVTDEASGSDRDPTWGPDGHLWFVSTRAGVVADDGRRLDAEIYELDLDSGEVTRRTWTPHVERRPVFFAIGEENGGEVGFTALREAILPMARAHVFRFPPNLETEYHPHFGINVPEDVYYDMRELPDGRYTVTVGDRENVWEGGRLAVVERNFGPPIPDGHVEDASIPFYADPVARLDPDAAASGVTASVYRDASPLPDGRVLVARSPTEADLADPDAAMEFRIEALTLAEDPRGAGPSIASREVLIEEAGISVYEPEPVCAKRAAPLPEEQFWDPDAETGHVRLLGIGHIAAILITTPPYGPKTLPAGVAGVRLIEALPLLPGEREPVPAEETRAGDPYATTTGLGYYPPARVLAEVPIFADASVQADLPAGVSFRVQALDAAGRAVDLPYNRWYYVAPGQKLSQGASGARDTFYTGQCAVCHGSVSGDPDEVFVEPDVMTTASLSLAEYEDQNPRHPIPPPQAGDATRVEADWRRDVRPLLAGCATNGCHAGEAPAAGLSLTDASTAWYDDAYESLVGDYVTPGSSYQSALVEWLLGEELSAASEAPPAPHGGLTAEQVGTITRWVDLGATWVGTP